MESLDQASLAAREQEVAEPLVRIVAAEVEPNLFGRFAHMVDFGDRGQPPN